ncbi:MAG: hypothetical protein HQK50_19250 [Oligoflexia bacterium]|nr:hypothetical protein [Oligoflexia bacterium]
MNKILILILTMLMNIDLCFATAYRIYVKTGYFDYRIQDWGTISFYTEDDTDLCKKEATTVVPEINLTQAEIAYNVISKMLVYQPFSKEDEKGFAYIGLCGQLDPLLKNVMGITKNIKFATFIAAAQYQINTNFSDLIDNQHYLYGSKEALELAKKKNLSGLTPKQIKKRQEKINTASEMAQGFGIDTDETRKAKEFLKMHESINQELERYKFDETKKFAEKLIPEDLAKSQIFLGWLQKAVSNYFGDLPVDNKRVILANFFKTVKYNDDDATKFAILAKHSGPFFKKIIQIFSDKNEDPEIRETLAKFKEQKIEASEKKPKVLEQLTTVSNLTPLSAASIGLVYKGKLKGEDIILKVKHKNIDDLAKTDSDYFENSLRNEPNKTDIEATWAGITDSIKSELNFTTEISNIKKANKIINGDEFAKSLGVCSITEKRIPENTSPDLMSMSMAKGKSSLSLHKEFEEKLRQGTFGAGQEAEINARNIRERARLISNLATVWIENALLKSSSFYHGDLHSGNTFLDIDPNNINPSKITMIDWGNAASLKSSIQKSIKLLIMALALNKPTDVYNAFIQMTNKGITTDQKNLLKSKAVEVVARNDLSFIDKILVLIKEAESNGVSLKGQFSNFMKAFLLLQNQMTNAQKDLWCLAESNKDKCFACYLPCVKSKDCNPADTKKITDLLTEKETESCIQDLQCMQRRVCDKIKKSDEYTIESAATTAFKRHKSRLLFSNLSFTINNCSPLLHLGQMPVLPAAQCSDPQE